MDGNDEEESVRAAATSHGCDVAEHELLGQERAKQPRDAQRVEGGERSGKEWCGAGVEGRVPIYRQRGRCVHRCSIVVVVTVGQRG